MCTNSKVTKLWFKEQSYEDAEAHIEVLPAGKHFQGCLPKLARGLDAAAFHGAEQALHYINLSYADC